MTAWHWAIFQYINITVPPIFPDAPLPLVLSSLAPAPPRTRQKLAENMCRRLASTLQLGQRVADGPSRTESRCLLSDHGPPRPSGLGRRNTPKLDGPVGDLAYYSATEGVRDGDEVRTRAQSLLLSTLHIGYRSWFDKARRGPHFPLGVFHLEECKSRWGCLGKVRISDLRSFYEPVILTSLQPAISFAHTSLIQIAETSH